MIRGGSRARTQDENLFKLTGKRQIEEGKSSKLGQLQVRTALGDITNNLQEQKMPEKKLQTKSSTVDEVQPKLAPAREEPLLQENASSSDAEMEAGEEHTNESVHLSELNLGQVPALSLVDAGDVNNSQAVVEYIAEIIAHYRRSEINFAPSREYMTKQNDISPKMREILIDWLVEVHLKFKLRPETLYLTVSNIDRFLERHAVSRTKLQLVGCTAMLLAAKYEEIYAPEVRDFVYISDKAYTREQILNMEAIMLRTLEYKLTVPTAFRFGERFIKVALTNLDLTHVETVANLAYYLMELTLQEYSFLKFLPSVIASSAVYLALKMVSQPWSQLLIAETRYDERALQECVTELYALAARDNSKYRAVRKKYVSRKYGEVALKVQFPMPQ